MAGVEHGTIGILILICLIIAPVLLYIKKAKRGRTFFVRRVAGIDAINEAVGLSAELGRPVSFCTGVTAVGPVLYACLGTLFHIGKKVAQYKSKLIIPQNDPEVMAIVEDTARDAYREEGRTNLFDPTNIQFLSNEQFAFAAGYSGIVQRERVGSAFLFGEFAAEALVLAEAGQSVGAMQVAASVSPEQVPFFICTCDYTLIGEELFAASAYITREPIQVGSLLGQYKAKLLFLVIIVLGVLIATLNSIYPELGIKNLDSLILWQWW